MRIWLTFIRACSDRYWFNSLRQYHCRNILEVRQELKECYYKWYPRDITFDKPIIQFKQICDDRIRKDVADERAADRWRQVLTTHTSFGFYGRLDKGALPMSIVAATGRAAYGCTSYRS